MVAGSVRQWLLHAPHSRFNVSLESLLLDLLLLPGCFMHAGSALRGL
jgi:hypothetical protein